MWYIIIGVICLVAGGLGSYGYYPISNHPELPPAWAGFCVVIGYFSVGNGLGEVFYYYN